MKTYELLLILSNEDPDDIEELCNRCYNEFSDSTIGSFCGICQIRVSREANCLEDAINSALASAKIVGVAVKKISLEPKYIT